MSIVITHDLVKKTLNDNNDGFRFEKFAQIFFSAITQNQNFNYGDAVIKSK